MTSHSTDQKDTYVTKGLGLAAYLWALGYELMETRWKGDLCMWVFPSTQELNDKVKEYLGGQARIDPQMYYKKLVEFRRKMWDTKPKEAAEMRQSDSDPAPTPPTPPTPPQPSEPPGGPTPADPPIESPRFR